MTQRPFVNVNDHRADAAEPAKATRPGLRLASRRSPQPLGATRLGCRLTELPQERRRSRTMFTTSMTSCS